LIVVARGSLRPLLPFAGEHVRLSRRLPEKFGRNKSIEEDVAHMRIESPQALDLGLRETQARHFQVLRPNKAKPIADRPRLSSHELSARKEKVPDYTSTRTAMQPPRPLTAIGRLFYCVEQMPRGELLGSLEYIVLLALIRLKSNAYGMTVRREIEERTGRNTSIGAVYTTLERLQTKGYVSSLVGEPTAERGGRAKRLFRIEADGERALRASQEAIRNMTLGLARRWRTT
jgi:PadR family transcriptional regulator, regulatory protein PadR